jgi:hypothetical protein
MEMIGARFGNAEGVKETARQATRFGFLDPKRFRHHFPLFSGEKYIFLFFA